MRTLTQSFVILGLLATLLFLVRCGKITEAPQRAIPELTLDCHGGQCL